MALIQAIAAFVATNLDDILVLLLFFAQGQHPRRSIILGQYLGFSLLVLLSLPGYWGSSWVPRSGLGLLGLVPLAIGLKLLFFRGDDEAIAAPELKSSPRRWPFLAPIVYQVAAVTLANGGDNISIYLPLFANQSRWSLLVILATFFSLVGLWCALAIALVQQPVIARNLGDRAHRWIPWVFIGLGLYILWDSGTIAHVIPR
jgi:cadmium resistance protein CadD (predicted permease)